MKSKNKKWAKLFASLSIDAIGMSSYLFDFFFGAGEVSDMAWAPIGAMLNQLLYQNTAMSAVLAIEEVLPFTDFVPTSTITWYLTYYGGKR